MSLEEKAKKLIKISGAAKIIEFTLNKMLATLNASNITAEEADILVEASVPAYANNLTEQEIDDAIAWYESESGKSMVSKNLSIMEESQSCTEELIQKIIYDRVQKGISGIFGGEDNA